MKDNFFDNLEDYKENKKTKCVNCGREVKDLEKDNLFQKYKDIVGEIITGEVY